MANTSSNTKRKSRTETKKCEKDGSVPEPEPEPEPSDESGTSSAAKLPKKQQMSIIEKIVYAIRSLNDGPNGSSRQGICKYLKSEFNLDYNFYVKQGFKKGVKNALLIQIGQRFRVATDTYENFVVKKDVTVQMNDLQVGQGDKITTEGDIVTIQYVGMLDDGTEFDQSKSFTFLLGAGEVIKGMDKGVTNMKEGGKRKLLIPSKLGYGRRGSPPEIPPNATLHFEITLKKIQRV